MRCHLDGDGPPAGLVVDNAASYPQIRGSSLAIYSFATSFGFGISHFQHLVLYRLATTQYKASTENFMHAHYPIVNHENLQIAIDLYVG